MTTLMYCMGNKADDILSSLRLLEDDKMSYDAVKTKLEGYFVQQKSIIYEHARFNQRRLEEGESFDSFITFLHCLAGYCGYQGLKNEMIRDQIVVGLRDANLLMNLQMVPNLSLEKPLLDRVKQFNNSKALLEGSLKLLTVFILARRAEKCAKQTCTNPSCKATTKQTCSRLAYLLLTLDRCKPGNLS